MITDDENAAILEELDALQATGREADTTEHSRPSIEFALRTIAASETIRRYQAQLVEPSHLVDQYCDLVSRLASNVNGLQQLLQAICDATLSIQWDDCHCLPRYPEGEFAKGAHLTYCYQWFDPIAQELAKTEKSSCCALGLDPGKKSVAAEMDFVRIRSLCWSRLVEAGRNLRSLIDGPDRCAFDQKVQAMLSVLQHQSAVLKELLVDEPPPPPDLKLPMPENFDALRHLADAAIQTPKPSDNVAVPWVVLGDIRLDRSLPSLPENLEIKGSLVLASGCPLTHLPSGLHIRGNLIARGSRLESLPSRLRVDGNLNVRETRVSEIPADAQIGGRTERSIPLGERMRDLWRHLTAIGS